VEAQKIIEEVVSFYNEQRVHQETEEVTLKRWDEAIKSGKGKLRPLDTSINLDVVFSLHNERTVKKDRTFSYWGAKYKLLHLAGMRVTVGVIPDKKAPGD
jgi:hypothetical protein